MACGSYSGPLFSVDYAMMNPLRDFENSAERGSRFLQSKTQPGRQLQGDRVWLKYLSHCAVITIEIDILRVYNIIKLNISIISFIVNPITIVYGSGLSDSSL
jgi:hypothetical protein